MEPSLVAVLSGFALCGGLIVSVGAQNAYLLRQGLRREHVGMLVLVCFLSDAAMQAAGIAGLATFITGVPWLETAARWLGAAVILWFGVDSARRAWRGGGSLEAAMDDPGDAEVGAGGTAVRTRARTSRKTALLTILAITWLNPHVAIESVLILGSVASGHGDERWWFFLGTITASAVWFVGFTYGARYLAPLLRTERAWRILDTAIALIMLAMAVMLVVA